MDNNVSRKILQLAPINPKTKQSNTIKVENKIRKSLKSTEFNFPNMVLEDVFQKLSTKDFKSEFLFITALSPKTVQNEDELAPKKSKHKEVRQSKMMTEKMPSKNPSVIGVEKTEGIDLMIVDQNRLNRINPKMFLANVISVKSGKCRNEIKEYMFDAPKNALKMNIALNKKENEQNDSNNNYKLKRIVSRKNKDLIKSVIFAINKQELIENQIFEREPDQLANLNAKMTFRAYKKMQDRMIEINKLHLEIRKGYKLDPKEKEKCVDAEFLKQMTIREKCFNNLQSKKNGNIILNDNNIELTKQIRLLSGPDSLPIIKVNKYSKKPIVFNSQVDSYNHSLLFKQGFV